MILTVPVDDKAAFPTLGPQVVDWMHENLVFGPGDVKGLPLELDAEQQAFLWKLYEVFPKAHPLAGRRRFRRGALSLAKGLRKTEFAACISIAEVHPSAPVRFNGWKGRGLAPGRGVGDPFVIMIATTEAQSDEGAYAAMCEILRMSPLADDFEIWKECVQLKNGSGKAVSVSSSPNAQDGARTTFQVFDETHRMIQPRYKEAFTTMMNNLPKRKMADPWMLEITTAFEPGAGAIAESTMDYARQIADGHVKDPSLFYYHREASDSHDLKTEEGVRAAVIEASGPAASWRDIDGVVRMFMAPDSDVAYMERVWCNRVVKGSSQAFDLELWRELAVAKRPDMRGRLITLGFDGGLSHDSTAIVATDVETGFQWIVGLWERPLVGAENWRVPADAVDATMRSLFETYSVWRLYADPPYWQSYIAAWQGDSKMGPEKVVEWQTNRRRPMSAALENFTTAIKTGELSHDGDKRLLRHLGNSRRDEVPGQRDEKGRPLWIIQKDRPDSPNKIDLAMAAVLSWEARTDAIAAGATRTPTYEVMLFGGGRH